MDKFQKEYEKIITELSKYNNGRRTINIDKWDVLAAIFMAAMTTASVIGIYYVAYYIVIALCTKGIGLGASVSAACVEWLSKGENREKAVKSIEWILRNPMKSVISKLKELSIADAHQKIKETIIELYDGNFEEFEKMIVKKQGLNEDFSD